MRPPAKLLVSHLSGRYAITRQRNARTVNKGHQAAILMLIAKPVATSPWPSAIRRQENARNAKPQTRTAIRLKELVTQLATMLTIHPLYAIQRQASANTVIRLQVDMVALRISLARKPANPPTIRCMSASGMRLSQHAKSQTLELMIRKNAMMHARLVLTRNATIRTTNASTAREARTQPASKPPITARSRNKGASANPKPSPASTE